VTAFPGKMNWAGPAAIEINESTPAVLLSGTAAPAPEVKVIGVAWLDAAKVAAMAATGKSLRKPDICI
jgi:hypothetical protein